MGHRLVVRNGSAAARQVVTGAGAVRVAAPRVNHKRTDPETGVRQRFSSAILPAWARKSPKVAEVLPLLYLHGLSSVDFGPAWEQFLGSGTGLSAATITRLTTQWQDEARLFADRSLSDLDYVYVWVDGIHVNVRLEQEKLRLLVMIGVRTDGKKELIALTDGYRESTESWAGLLRDAKRRGMRAPVLAMGDGALGFWAAVKDVFPADEGAAVLVPQVRKYACRAPEIGAPGGGPSDAGHLQTPRTATWPAPRARTSRRPTGEVPQSRREDHRRPRCVAGVLQLPGRILGASADDERSSRRSPPHQGRDLDPWVLTISQSKF